MKPTLFTSPGSHNCRRVTVLIHELGLDVKLSFVDVRPPGMGGENEKADFLQINPNGKVPVLQDGPLTLFESNAIMEYLADKSGPSSIWPEDIGERAQIRQWQFWQAAHLSPCADGFLVENMVKPMMGGAPAPDALERHRKAFERWAGVLERTLSRDAYLVGNRFTCADISLVSALMYANSAQIPIEGHKLLTAWIRRVHDRPSWKATQPPPMKM